MLIGEMIKFIYRREVLCLLKMENVLNQSDHFHLPVNIKGRERKGRQQCSSIIYIIFSGRNLYHFRKWLTYKLVSEKACSAQATLYVALKNHNRSELGSGSVDHVEYEVA